MRPLLITLFTCALAFSQNARADLYSEVNALIQSGQWPQAMTLAQTRLQTAPTDPQMRLLQSRIQTGMGQTQEAMATLRALTQSFPELPEPHNNLAVLLVQENRHAEAIESLTKAIQVRPDYALALENLGDTHIALAAQAYGRALKVPPAPSRLTHKQQAAQKLLNLP